MAVEHFTSGTTPQRSDTRRILFAKKLNKDGGAARTSDTVRLLLAKRLNKLNGVTAPLPNGAIRVLMAKIDKKLSGGGNI